jgi:hypothetical protein
MEKLRILWDTAMKINQPETSHSQNISLKESLRKQMLELQPNPLFPQTKIPNVREFKIEVLSNYHPILEEHGILKRQFAPLIKQTAYRNRAQNRYITRQMQRLNKLRSSPREF